MLERDSWLEVAHNVLAHPLRTALTGVSVALGIFILVVMQGLGFGLQHGVEQQFADDAVNSIWVEGGRTQMPYRGSQSNRPVKLTNADMPGLKAQADTVPSSSRRIRMWGAEVVWANPRGENQTGSFGLRGVDPAHIELERSTLLSGRFINARDVAESRKVAVVGPNIVEELFQTSEPVGTFVRINGILFQVVGTFEDPGSRWENRVVYVPFTTAQGLFRSDDSVDQVIYSTGDMTTDATVVQSARMLSWLKDVKAIHPEDARGVRVDNNNEEYAMYASIFEGIRLFIWGIGLMTLLAGAVGVANILAIGVKERTKEIGVRKALGATNGSIVGLVVMESTVLMLISGCVGLMFSVGLLSVVAPMANHEYFQNPQVDHRIALFALGVLVLVGLASGLGPALRAVAIRPVEALRDE
ncbi:MAG: ABC transporter permease [Bacteroidetes bacterium]|jgi:putative ABC transport system permease protein|nr:ABC transporter permease [Bacteroidota bacterium]